MDDIKISLVASAVRPFAWQGFFESLKGNTLPIEVVFVGDVKPDFDLPPNCRHIYATVKPAQCYEIGIREARGELIGWTADDARYDHIKKNSLDLTYNYWKSFNDEKVIVAMRPIEDGRDVWNTHHFFGGWQHTPLMAPFGIMSRKFLMDLGGYDKNFISGQAENDIVMRIIEAGGRVEMFMDGYLFVRHNEIHRQSNDHASFRKWYVADRQYLENCWVKDGYGKYTSREQQDKSAIISPKRLLPVQSFEDKDITTVTQGEKGRWE